MFSLDRFVTLGFFRPLARLGLYRPEQGVPILMYHSISAADEPGVSPYYRLNTSPRRFRQQMQWLREAGWRIVPVEEALGAAAGGRRVAALTFDDGYRDFLTAAWPILAEFGYPATVYLPTGRVDEGGEFRGKPLLNWKEVRWLADQGIDFGSHTVHHVKLGEVTPEEAMWELVESRRRLEDELGRPVKGFSLPYAFPEGNPGVCNDLMAAVQAAGYRYLLTTRLGRHRVEETVWRVRRLPCNDSDDRSLLLAKLAGLYDWLYPLQRFVKRVRRREKTARPTGRGD
ncbi:MAG: hypothetical protein Kow00109_05810 [Acidobacteriota bacterium]